MSRAALFAVLVSAGAAAVADPVAEVVIDSIGIGDGCPFAGDHMTLTLRDGSHEIARHPFCSSYGRAHATVERDAKGSYYVLLWSNEGHGTRATEEYLTVFLLSTILDEYLRTPVAGAASADTDWSYDVHVEKPSGGGLRLSLARGLRGHGRDGEWYPEPEVRQLSIGAP